jgi:hypothetical protein
VCGQHFRCTATEHGLGRKHSLSPHCAGSASGGLRVTCSCYLWWFWVAAEAGSTPHAGSVNESGYAATNKVRPGHLSSAGAMSRARPTDCLGHGQGLVAKPAACRQPPLPQVTGTPPLPHHGALPRSSRMRGSWCQQRAGHRHLNSLPASVLSKCPSSTASADDRGLRRLSPPSDCLDSAEAQALPVLQPGPHPNCDSPAEPHGRDNTQERVPNQRAHYFDAPRLSELGEHASSLGPVGCLWRPSRSSYCAPTSLRHCTPGSPDQPAKPARAWRCGPLLDPIKPAWYLLC